MTKSQQKQPSLFLDESADLYFAQVKNCGLLDHEQELALSRRIQAGDTAALDELIQGNLRLVITIARQYCYDHASFTDLIQEGNMGLIHAAQKYDYRHEVRFSTYAAWWIKQAITRAIDNKQRLIRLPHRKEEALRKIRRSFNSLGQTLERKPSIDEVARDVEMDREDVVSILQSGNPVASFDAAISEETGTLHDVYQDVHFEPQALLEKQVIQDEVNDLLRQLESRERQVVSLRFALGGAEKQTLKSISQTMGVSPETVRQIEMRAIRKLRDLGAARGLDSVLA